MTVFLSDRIGVDDVPTYCCGLMFSLDRQYVGLIQKDTQHKPEQAWQHGRFNGIGGKVEVGENARAAMVREFHEETGVATEIKDWELFATWKGNNPPNGHDILMFRAFSDAVYNIRKVEREQPIVYTVRGIYEDPTPVPNLRFMVPLALTDSKFTEPVRFRTR